MSGKKGSRFLFPLIIIGLVLFLLFFPCEIKKIDVLFNGEVIDNYSFEIGSVEYVDLSTIINDGNFLTKIKIMDKEWSFEGNNLGLYIEENKLVFSKCDTIGETNLVYTVKSANELKAIVKIKSVPKVDSELIDIELGGFSNDTKQFIEGQLINNDDFIIIAKFASYSAKVLDFKIYQEKYLTENNTVQIEYSYNGVDKVLIVPVTIKSKSLQEIVILSAPDKTTYIEGQTFDGTGLKIVAKYEFIEKEISDFYFDTKILTTEDTFVTIYYTESNIEGSITKTIKQEINVTHRTLQSISADTSDVRLEYVQGETFDKTNLIVKALFDIGEYEITEFEIDTEKILTKDDTEIIVSYTENNITKTCAIAIVVNEPYLVFRNITISEEPTSIRLTWQYSYLDNSGEVFIDNTTYEEYGLVFNEENGIYQIPVGAVVTIEALDNSIIDFYFNEVAQGLTYPSKTLTFRLEKDSEDLNVTLKKINGTISLMFKNEINNLSLTYYQGWNGIIKDEDLDKIVFVFEENNENYYNVFIIDNTEYSFEELKLHKFDSSVIIDVEQREIIVDNTITLILRENYQIKVSVDKSQENWKENIPEPSRVGYSFIEFEEIETDVFKAKWQLIEVTYTGDFIGEWNYSVDNGENFGDCQIILNSNGTYTYKSWLNSELNLNFTGIYRYDTENSKLELLSVELDSETVNIKPQDIDLTYENDELSANLIVVDNENNLQTIKSAFEKAE